MNFLEVSYLITSDSRFSVKKLIEDYITQTFGRKREKYIPFISEIEEFFDKDLGLFKAVVKINYPVILFNHDLYSILSIIYGETFLPADTKLIDIDFPPSFLDHFSGVNFGIDGIRNKVGIKHRPLIMVTLKNLNGIEREEFVNLLEEVISGGADIIREEEIFFSDHNIPFKERVKIVSETVEKSGKNILYAPFISGTPSQMEENVSYSIEKGIDLFTINLFPAGIQNLHFLSKTFKAGFIVNPGYPSFFYEHDRFGIEPEVLFGKIIRLAGGDIVLIPSPYSKKDFTHHRSVDIANALQEKFENIKPSAAALCGQIKIDDLRRIFQDFGNQIVIDIGNSYLLYKKELSSIIKAYIQMMECIVSGISDEECKSINPEIQL